MFQKYVNGVAVGEIFDAALMPDSHTDDDGNYVTYNWASLAAQDLQKWADELYQHLVDAKEKLAAYDSLNFEELTLTDVIRLSRLLTKGEFKSKGDVLAALQP